MNNSTSTQLQDRQPSATTDLEKYIILCFFVTTLFLGLVGNILVLIIVAKKRVKRTTNDVFVMNLAISDLTMVFFIPLQICDLYGRLPANAFTCNFVRPLMTVTFFVSIFTLSSMAVYRCKVILNPLRPEMKELFAILLLLMTWVISLGLVLPLMVVSRPYTSFTCMEDWPSVTHRRSYTVALVLLQYILPLLIIAVAYMRIGLDLYRARIPRRLSFRRKSSCKDNSAGKVNFKARKRENKQVIKTLATIVIMFALCLLPGQVTWMMADFSDKSPESLNIWFKFSLVLSVCHSCLNPLVYGTLTRQFRRGYIKYLSYLLCCCETSSTVQRLRMLRDDSTRTDSRKRTASFGFHNEKANPVTTSTTTTTTLERTTTCFPRYLRLGSNGNVKNGHSTASNCNGSQGETLV